jgi:hypothetical protein
VRWSVANCCSVVFFWFSFIVFYMVICFVYFCLLLYLLLCLCIFSDKYALFCILFANWHSSATLTEVFRTFSSVVRQMPGYTSQRRGMARTLPNRWIVLFCVLFVSIVLFYLLFVCKCVLYYCHRVSTQLQLNVSYHMSYTVSYCIISYHIISIIP